MDISGYKVYSANTRGQNTSLNYEFLVVFSHIVIKKVDDENRWEVL